MSKETGTALIDVLAEHQKHGMGMSGNSPDTCKCGAKVYPENSDGYIEARRDYAFAVHQSEAIITFALATPEPTP